MKNNFKILTKISLTLFAFCLLIFLNGAGAFFNNLISRATAEENSLPRLELSKSISPDEIFPGGTARITLGVEAIGESYERHSPVDVMHVIDTSGSMDWYGNIIYSGKGNLSGDWEQIDSFSADSSSDAFDVLLITNSSDYRQYLEIKSPSDKWYGYNFDRRSQSDSDPYKGYYGAENIRIEENNFEEGSWEIWAKGKNSRAYNLAVGSPPVRINAVKEAANYFIDIMQENDQIGVVSFNKRPKLVKKLTFLNGNRDSIKSAVNSLEPEKSTAIGKGIEKANKELKSSRGRAEITQAMILLSDGVNNVDRPAPIKAAEGAKETGIIIYTIGIGEADQNLLEEIADLTGGQYYYVNNSDHLSDIYNQISQGFSDLTASNIIVQDILPDYVEYAGNASEEPNEIIENSDGTTTLIWNLDKMKINDSWSVSFDVNVHKEKEIWPANIYPDSKVDFIDYQGESAEISFPEVLVKIISENGNGGNGGDGNGGDNGNGNGGEDGNNNGRGSGGGTGGGGGWIPSAISYPDLTISKTDKRDKVLQSEELTYKILWQNIGKASASGLTIIDTLSNYVSFVFASDNGIYNSESHSVSWNVSESIKSGDAGYVSLKVKVLESMKEEVVILNQAEISTETKELNISNNKAEDRTEITGIVLGEETSAEKTEEPKVLPEAGADLFSLFIVIFLMTGGFYQFQCILKLNEKRKTKN